MFRIFFFLLMIMFTVFPAFISGPVYAQNKITIEPIVQEQPIIKSGPWFGATAKGDFSSDHIQVEGGYFIIADSTRIFAASLNYDTQYDTYGPQGYYLQRVRSRFYIGGSAGLDFTNSDFNNTAMYAANLLYLPGWKTFAPMYMFFNLRLMGRALVIDQTVTEVIPTDQQKPTVDDNGEIWLTIGLAGL